MIIGFIPARAGSKGIPHKNIVDLGGKPLIAWTIEGAKKAGLQRVIVNTDSKEIAKIAEEYGAEVMYVPPRVAKRRHIHQDDSSMFDVLSSEIPRISPKPDAVALLQATVPLRDIWEIRRVVNELAVSECDSVFTVEEVPSKYNPAQIMVDTPAGLRMVDGREVKDRIQRRQLYPKAYIPTGSIYLFRTANLEKGNLYGDDPCGIVTPPTINIDTVADLEAARKWIQK